MTTVTSDARPWRKWARDNSVGVNFVQRAISSSRLKVRRVGKRMIVLPEDGITFLQTLPEGPAAMPANLKRPGRSAAAGNRSEEGV
jgi:hypothetical protein